MQPEREHRPLGAVVLLAAALALATATPPRARASVLAGPVVNPANGHAYYLLAEDTWQSSEAQAVALGGHLATIRDDAEQSWVFATFGAWGGTSRSLWIGLNDAADEGHFVWSSGEAVSYAHWLPGQPDNSPVTGGETYVHLLNTGNVYGHPGGFWNDLASPNTGFPTFDPVCGVVEVRPPVLAVRNDPFRICWLTEAGARYQVQATTDPASAGWTDVGATIDGTGGTACAGDLAPGAAARWFRVAVLR